MSFATRILFPLLATTSLLVGASAQTPAAPLTPAAPAPATRPATNFVLEAGELTITDLIDRAAAYLQVNILVNAMDLQTTGPGSSAVKLQRRVEVDAQGCQEVVANLLSSAGLCLTVLDEGKQVYEVISANGPRNREISNRAPHRTPEEVLARPNLRMAVTSVVQLQYTNAVVATNALRPFFASTGGPGSANSIVMGTAGNNSGIVLSGMQDQVANAIRMLRTLDVPPPKELDVSLAQKVATLQERVAKLEQAIAKLTETPAEKR